jgi:hypothetical protein
MARIVAQALRSPQCGQFLLTFSNTSWKSQLIVSLSSCPRIPLFAQGGLAVRLAVASTSGGAPGGLTPSSLARISHRRGLGFSDPTMIAQ